MTNVELDLQRSTSGDYQYTATEESDVINGKFGAELLPVAIVSTFVWSTHSVTFWVQGETIRLMGLGFS